MNIDSNFLDRTGFRFVYSKRHLSKSELIFSKDLDSIGDDKKDDENMVVLCKSCGEYMTYNNRDSIFTSFYKCPVCGIGVKESTLYKRLDDENKSFMDEYEDIYGSDEDDDEGMPDICADCDGPYPKCVSSCRFFDED